MRTRSHVIPLLLCAAACGDDSSVGAGDAPRGGGGGKADLVGSCQGSDCDGPAAGGSCYCDDACVEYGDCCADRADLCGGAAPGFTVETVATTGDTGDRPSVAIDPAGLPVIAFHDWDNIGSAIRVARRVAGGWVQERVTDDDEVVTGSPTSIALDPDGRAHVVYRARAGFGVTPVHREQRADGSWLRTAVELGGAGRAERAGDDASVAIGPDGVVHVVALRTLYTGTPAEPHTELRHAWRDAGGWHSELATAVVGFGAHAVRASEVAIDGAGQLHVALTSPPDETLLHLRRGPSGWARAVVAPYDRAWLGRPRLAAGRDGAAHIAFTPSDGELTQLVHAAGRGGSFTLETVAPDAGGVTTASVSVGVAPDGVAHLIFETDDALRHARGGEAGSDVIDDTREPGAETAIAIGGGVLHVAYHEEHDDDLRAAATPVE